MPFLIDPPFPKFVLLKMGVIFGFLIFLSQSLVPSKEQLSIINISKSKLEISNFS